jgi:hypothetical protein
VKNLNSSREPLTLLWDKNMKHKSNAGYTLLELLIVLAFIFALSSLLVSLYKKANRPSIDIPRSDPSSELVVKKHGSFFYGPYVVFEDKPTKTRIFYYNKAMVILPPEKNGN